jgi:hypothetical protein
MSNPLVVLAYIAVFAGSGIAFRIDELWEMIFYIIGFSSGALAWGITLALVANAFRHKFNLRTLFWFNKIAGVLIILFVIALTIYVLIFGSPKL